MKLYSYFRSSAAYRVRIALNLKGIAADYVPVHLVKPEPLPAYRDAVNPQGLVPAIEAGEDGLIAQSLAIIEYLEEKQPEPPLLPSGLAERAYVRSAALLVACDIHPLANLRVLRYLKRELGQEQATIDAWYRHWVEDGLARLEAFVAGSGRSGAFLHGDAPTMADCCLVPQLFNARRLACDLSGFPTLVEIDARCARLEAFQRAHPDVQPDAE
ncbi:maleylacetoacetate isomerase [Rhizorhabdus dicambivorans]|uniref:Maleylacetoacetate isomerase n=1 Tax=Rhizorhabdus dicambivorans TaxID=1850238 RepID=A0A2A4FUL5_9SPHN|nr:maleylacetoacetate isomerase [Rhizorhabdus dicambivorans]ATE63572.1 maleylacetoacetate isomerase [Rhizorhabdus dicambivorans]PCE41372.1 maleylacetoacetate isomerase [Rhizorhabdus dicambivorans]